MRDFGAWLVAGAALASAPVASGQEAAAPPPLSCFGQGPVWRLDLDGRRARLSLPPSRSVVLEGRFSTDDPAKSLGWRGRPAGGRGPDVAAFVSEGTCTDVSAVEHPFAARVSLPDGRFLSGCCRRAAPEADLPPEAEAKPAPVAPPTPAPTSGDWISSLVTFFPSIDACVQESRRTEAVVFATVRPDKTVHLVLRLPGPRYADCHLPPGRGNPKVTLRAPDSALSGDEQAGLLTLLPHEAPSEACFRSQLVYDEHGRRFGWVSRKGC